MDRMSAIVRIGANGLLFILATPIALMRVRPRCTISVWLSKNSVRTQEIFNRCSSRSIAKGYARGDGRLPEVLRLTNYRSDRNPRSDRSDGQGIPRVRFTRQIR